MLYRVGRSEIDDQTLTVTCDGVRVPVQRRVLDLIVYLIKNRERVVTNDELLEKVWGGLAVTRASIAHSAMKARRALGDTGGSPSLIASVRGRGLRFIGAVVETSSVSAHPAQPSSDRLSSFSSATESVFQLVQQMTAQELEGLLPFHFLVIPQHQLVRGNPWVLKTAPVEENEETESSRELEPTRSIEVFELWSPGQSLSIGRTRACNIVVREQSVSKVHATLSFEPRLTIEDLGSQNGTRVNGSRINGPAHVQSGDTLHFGDVLAHLLSSSALHAYIAGRG